MSLTVWNCSIGHATRPRTGCRRRSPNWTRRSWAGTCDRFKLFSAAIRTSKENWPRSRRKSTESIIWQPRKCIHSPAFSSNSISCVSSISIITNISFYFFFFVIFYYYKYWLLIFTYFTFFLLFFFFVDIITNIDYDWLILLSVVITNIIYWILLNFFISLFLICIFVDIITNIDYYLFIFAICYYYKY